MPKNPTFLAISAVLVALAVAMWLALERPTPSPGIADQESALGTGNVLSNRSRVLAGPEDSSRGASEPLVTLVAFIDFSGRMSKRAARTLFEAFLAYPEEVRVVIKLLPDPEDEGSTLAAAAALAAGGQGKFWEMHDALFSSQNQLSRRAIEGIAKGLELDTEAFETTLDDEATRQTLSDTSVHAERVGVYETPALFLNGLRIDDGAMPFVRLKPHIERELERVRAMMAERELEASEVYQTLMKDARSQPLPARTTGGG